MRGKLLFFMTLAAALMIFTACEPKPQSIELGSDQCAYCRMMITEAEFGTQSLNNQGRAFKFDSIECLGAYVLTTDTKDNIHSNWVPDFLNRDNWLPAESAVYLHSETLRSPMGLNLTAYADRESALPMQAEYGGELVTFEEVMEIVTREWLNNNRQMSR